MNGKTRRPARLEIGLEVVRTPQTIFEEEAHCLLYTSDAADE